MKRFAKPALVAGAIALAATLAMPQPAQAHSSGSRVAAGAIIGLAAGAIIGSAIHQPRYRAHYGYNTYYYPPYYPSGPVYYSYGGYHPHVAVPHRHRYYRSRGVQFHFSVNPYHPNW